MFLKRTHAMLNRWWYEKILQKSPNISNKSNMLNATHPVLVDGFFPHYLQVFIDPKWCMDFSHRFLTSRQRQKTLQKQRWMHSQGIGRMGRFVVAHNVWNVCFLFDFILNPYTLYLLVATFKFSLYIRANTYGYEFLLRLLNIAESTFV